MALYKYMPGSSAIRLFETAMVRFTHPAEFNDPFELRPHIRGLADPETITRQRAIAFEPQSIEAQVTSAMKKMALTPLQESKVDRTALAKGLADQASNVLQFMSNISDALGPTLATQMGNIFNRELGIFSLSEEPLNLLMWAHYGDYHRGIVIEFDETNAFFNRRKGTEDDLRHFRPVTYAETRPSIFLSRSDAVQVFYCKSTEWAYEKEWRLIVPLSDASARIERLGGYPICLFKVPSDAIRGVIFGCRTIPTLHYELSSLIRLSPQLQHIEFSRAELDECHFALHRHELPSQEVDSWLTKYREHNSRG